jgi:hypothetical protein
LIRYTHQNFNNRYDPVTKTIYLHYGYGSGATGPTGYTRQIYERLVLRQPPVVTSYTPATGTSGTEVTIKGHNFFDLFNIRIGDAYCDTFRLLDDTLIIAEVGAGSSVKYGWESYWGIDTSGTFAFTPPPLSPYSMAVCGYARLLRWSCKRHQYEGF